MYKIFTEIFPRQRATAMYRAAYCDKIPCTSPEMRCYTALWKLKI